MTRVLRSATKKIQAKDNLSSNLNISKKSKIIKKRTKEILELNNKDSQKNLVEFNTVCKKRNHLTNPIIHKNIKLNRNWDILKQVHCDKPKKATKIDAEVVECISNNAKHALFVKEFRYSYELDPRIAIEVFTVFKFIRNLTIKRCEISKDQFIGMISPLNQIQQLVISGLRIKRIIRRRLYKEAIKLPPSLKKLYLTVDLIDNPELFIQTINTHSSLVEFSVNTFEKNEFLEPFYKPYPSLIIFEYENYHLQSLQSLIKVLKQNLQLNSLKLTLGAWNSELTNFISNHLKNLEELSLSEFEYSYRNYSPYILKFSQKTKIKKLNLEYNLSSCSYDSILLNCPLLEDLTFNRFKDYNISASELFINLSKPSIIKKLTINCHNFSGAVLDSLLLSCPHLNELVVNLPAEWKKAIKSICEICSNLRRLDISPPLEMYHQERDTFSRELRKTDFFTNSSKIISNLTHLSLNSFKAHNSKAELFKNFKNLKSIKFPAQNYRNYSRPYIKTIINMNFWLGYRLLTKDNQYGYDIEFKKILYK